MSKRIWSAILGCFALSATTVLAQDAPAVSETTTTTIRESAPKPTRSSRGSNSALQLLMKRVDRVDWTDAPLDDVINWLRDESDGRVNILPHWRSLSAENVSADSLVSVTLADSTVAEILDEVANQLSEDGEVSYRAEDNKLILSTRTAFDRQLVVKVYDATDIQFRAPNMGQSAPRIDLQNQNRSGGGGGGGGGSQGVFGGGGGSSGEENVGGQQEEQEIERRLQILKETIEATIAPETWNTGQAGTGGRGRIEVFNSYLVVLNTIDVHEQLAGVFSWSK